MKTSANLNTIKTSELSGKALDYAVALCEGKRPSMFIYQQTGGLAKEHNYSSDWSQGGPIIERERIDVWSWIEDWSAGTIDTKGIRMHGNTPLIAAMRCFVASKLGDGVDIPDELL